MRLGVQIGGFLGSIWCHGSWSDGVRLGGSWVPSGAMVPGVMV